MGKIYVIRHGSYEGYRSTERLTPSGRDQAESAGYGLQALDANIRWQLVSSEAPRAVQTAEIIGRIIGTAPIMSSLITRAGETVEDSAAFEARIKAAVEEGGTEYDRDLPVAVIGHLPLLACVAGDPHAEIGKGEMLEYIPDMWDGSVAEL